MYRIIGGNLKEYGPVSADEVIDWIREKRANGQTQARRADAEDDAWLPLSAFPEFAEALERHWGSGSQPRELDSNETVEAASDEPSSTAGESGEAPQAGALDADAAESQQAFIPLPAPYSPEPLDAGFRDFLAPAVLTTLCCCPVFGTVAVALAAMANAKRESGALEEAAALSRRAVFWTWVALGSGLFAWLVFFILSIAAQQ